MNATWPVASAAMSTCTATARGQEKENIVNEGAKKRRILRMQEHMEDVDDDDDDDVCTFGQVQPFSQEHADRLSTGLSWQLGAT